MDFGNFDKLAVLVKIDHEKAGDQISACLQGFYSYFKEFSVNVLVIYLMTAMATSASRKHPKTAALMTLLQIVYSLKLSKKFATCAPIRA